MAKVSTLVDGFSSQNNTLWLYQGTAAVSAGALVLVPDPSYGNKIDSNSSYDLTSSAIYVQVVPAPQGNGSIDTYLKLYQAGSNEVSFYVENGLLNMNETISGSSSNTSITYDPVAHAWWRIRHDGTNLLWETAPDGLTWTVRRTKIPGATWSAVTVQLMAGYFGTEPTPGQSTFDNVNVPPPVTLTVQPGGNLPASARPTLTAGTLLTSTPGSAAPATVRSTLNTSTALASGPGGTVPAGTPVSGVSATALAAAAGAASPARVAATVLSSTVLAAQPSVSAGSAPLTVFAAGIRVVAVPGGTQPAGTASTVALGVPGVTVLAANPGTALPGGSSVQTVAGWMLTAAGAGPPPGSSRAVLATGTALTASAGATAPARSSSALVVLGIALLASAGGSTPAGTAAALTAASPPEATSSPAAPIISVSRPRTLATVSLDHTLTSS